MALYMQTPWGNGDVTTKGFEKWNEIYAYSWGSARSISLAPGTPSNASRTSLVALNLSKPFDRTSIDFGRYVSRGGPVNLTIVNVSVAAAVTVRERFEFFRAWVETQQFSGSDDNQPSAESVSLVFERQTTTHFDATGKETASWTYNQLV